jgi:hypothetical protein
VAVARAGAGLQYTARDEIKRIIVAFRAMVFSLLLFLQHQPPRKLATLHLCRSVISTSLLIKHQSHFEPAAIGSLNGNADMRPCNPGGAHLGG